MIRMLPVLALLAAAVPGPDAAAESSTEARLRDALRSATAQLQAAEDERSRLQATSAEQKKEIDALQARLAASAKVPPPPRPEERAERQRAQRELAEATRRLGEQAEAGTRLAQDLSKCQAAEREARDRARAREGERAQLAEQLGPLNDRLSACEGRNAKMYAVAREILERYQRMSLGEALGAKEPFLGLRRVELENLAQDYQDRLLDQQTPETR